MGGLNSIHPNDVAIQTELDSNWEVLGEPIQTAMRACELAGLPGMDKPYEKVKELMRGHEISRMTSNGSSTSRPSTKPLRRVSRR